MENYCLFSKLIPLGSSYFLRNCSLTNMLSFSDIFCLSVSLCFSLGVCQLPALSLCISNSSLPLLFVYLSSVSCCSSVFLYLCLHLLSYSPASAFPLCWGTWAFLSFKNISSPLPMTMQSLNNQDLNFESQLHRKESAQELKK